MNLIGATIGVVVGTCIILFLCSWASLEYTELGLNYSVITKTVQNEGYQAGRYFLGIGHEFIRFPSTVQTIQYADSSGSEAGMLRSRTLDGLEVELEVSFQYLVTSNHVYELYMTYNVGYHDIFVRMATDVLTTAATMYTATDFFQNRELIGQQMGKQLTDHFHDHAFVDVPFFQLRTVNLPHPFEESIQETEVRKQEISTANATQQSTCVEYQTKVIQAQKQVEVLEQEGQANAAAVKLQNDAWIQQFNASMVLQALSYKELKEQAFDDDAASLLEFMSIRAVRDHAGKVIAGVPMGAGIGAV